MSDYFINPHIIATAPLLLDEFSGAAVAYSLRKLKTGVTDVIRVRRSSDSGESDFSPTEITDGTLTTYTGAGDGFVTKMYDQEGNIDAAQGTINSQPMIVDSGSLVVDLNGLPAMKANVAGATFLTAPSVSESQPITYFVAMDMTSAALGVTSIFDGDTNRNLLDSRGTDYRIYAGTTVLDDGNVTAAPHILTALYNGSSSVFRDNQTDEGIGDPGASGIDNLHVWGKTGLLGMASELVMYASDKTSDFAAIETNMNNHYSFY